MEGLVCANSGEMLKKNKGRDGTCWRRQLENEDILQVLLLLS